MHKIALDSRYFILIHDTDVSHPNVPQRSVCKQLSLVGAVWRDKMPGYDMDQLRNNRDLPNSPRII